MVLLELTRCDDHNLEERGEYVVERPRAVDRVARFLQTIQSESYIRTRAKWMRELRCRCWELHTSTLLETRLTEIHLRSSTAAGRPSLPRSSPRSSGSTSRSAAGPRDL